MEPKESYIIIGVAIVLGLLFFLLHRIKQDIVVFNSVVEKNSVNIGRKVLIDGDTLTVVDYGYNTYDLSNGVVISDKLFEIIKLN